MKMNTIADHTRAFAVLSRLGWIAMFVGASSGMTARPRGLGVILGVLLAVHAAVGPRIPGSKFKLFIFVLPCMAAWLSLIALNA